LIFYSGTFRPWSNKTMKRKKLWIIGILSALMCVVLVIFISKNEPADPGGLKIETDVKHASHATSIPNINFKGITNFRVDADTGIGHAKLTNPAGNPCYFKFILTLSSTGELLYESNYVKPGDTLENEKLLKSLSPGKHKARLNVETKSLSKPHEDLNGLETMMYVTVE
jgi:hypothetical protein